MILSVWQYVLSAEFNLLKYMKPANLTVQPAKILFMHLMLFMGTICRGGYWWVYNCKLVKSYYPFLLIPASKRDVLLQSVPQVRELLIF